MSIRGRGYTLVEVLIFIGLTSFLLFFAISNIGGNQAHVQFSQSARDFESRMSDLINDVPTGYFPTNGTLSCDASLPGQPVIGSAGNSGLGSDNDCIYVGKALQFSPDGNGDNVRIFTLAGRRISAAGAPAQSIDEALPVAVASVIAPFFDDSVEVITLQNGVFINRVFRGDTAAVPPASPPVADQYGIVGVITNFEGSSPTNNVSEGQSVQIGGLAGSVFGSINKATAVTNINTSLSIANYETPNEGIVICLTDDRGRRASLTIGSSGSSGVRLDLDSYNVGCN